MVKKVAVAIVLVGLGTIAHAQSSVQIYGVMDTAVEYMNNVGKDKSSLTRMPSLTGSGPSLLGFRGREDLGGGLSAGFALEMGIAPDSGELNQGGRGFGRQSFVSLNGSWGSLGLGRQYTMLFWSTHNADVIGPNMHSMSVLDSYFPNARADNSISYKGTFSGLTLGATYSLGRDAVKANNPGGTNCPGEKSGDSKNCREWSALLKYDAAEWGVALAHDALRGGPGAFAGLDSSKKTDKRSMLNGYVKLGEAKIGAGYMNRKNDGDPKKPRSNLWFVGVSYPVGQWTFDAQYNQLKYQHSADKGQLVVVRGIYKLSKRTAVYTSLGHITNRGKAAFNASGAQPGGGPNPGVNQTGFGAGLSHRF